MSKWLDKLNPASFRGVQFYLMEDPTAAVGRRRANHQYAGRDEPYSEDMGRKQRVYSIAGGVDGDDFIEKANRLQDAFEQRGAGILVHPFLGELNVTVEATFTYQGRFVSFQLTAEEAGTDDNPSGVVDTRSVVSSKSDLSKQSAIDAFADSYDVSGPEFVREYTLNNMLDSVALFNNAIALSVDELSSLIQQPRALAESFFSSVSTPLRTGARLLALDSLLAADVQTAQTVPRQRIEKNNKAVNQLLAQAVVIEESREVVSVNFESQSQAKAQVSNLVDALDNVSWQSNDAVYRQLSDLRVAVQQDMQARVPSLPNLQTVTINQMMPALVAAYRYTGDIANEQQIIDRNAVSHPGFVRGSVEVINV